MGKCSRIVFCTDAPVATINVTIPLRETGFKTRRVSAPVSDVEHAENDERASLFDEKIFGGQKLPM
jgi:hypothetical protein